MNQIKNEMVLVLDFGSKHREAAARAARRLNVYSEIRPGRLSAQEIRKINPIGIILTGKPNDAHPADPELFKLGIPVLEMENQVSDTDVLKKFLFDTCGAAGNYSIESYIETQVNQIKEAVGDEKILLALSGGVDSSVCAALLTRAVPNQLTCIFVDHGFMRLDEGNSIEAVFGSVSLNFIRVNAQDRFLAKVAGVADPEKKRKIIGEEFIVVFEEEAKKLGHIPYFCQGTIYADIMESGGDYGNLVKSHHNVGGMPEKLGFDKVVEPLAGLFKDEVRALGQKLGLPASLTQRQPFPGPGLAVRVTGEITKDRLDVLRLADAIVRDEIERAALDPGVMPSQYFAVITNTRSVGLKDEKRTFDYVIAIRAVITQDFIECEYAPIPHETLARMAARITNEIPQVSRVVYDITSKPPATTEWE